LDSKIINQLIALSAIARRPVACPCKGKKRLNPLSTCQYCGGTGFFSACEGSGWDKISQQGCGKCGGLGSRYEPKKPKDGFR
jgi:DnaJ-class molecular chaperone